MLKIKCLKIKCGTASCQLFTISWSWLNNYNIYCSETPLKAICFLIRELTTDCGVNRNISAYICTHSLLHYSSSGSEITRCFSFIKQTVCVCVCFVLPLFKCAKFRLLLKFKLGYTQINESQYPNRDRNRDVCICFGFMQLLLEDYFDIRFPPF